MQNNKNKSVEDVGQLSVFKQIAFSVIICVLFFVFVEMILWGFGASKAEQNRDPFLGFSTQTKLFRESSFIIDGLSKPVMTTNSDKLFFFQPQSFRLEKPENVRRLFCIGGSTTYGRPYEHNTSFCGWLADFLKHTDPEHKWEVINAGGISYASYRVVLLLEELIQYKPDLIISYVGQNEFLERRTYSQILDLPKFLRDIGTAASRLRIYALMSNLIGQLKSGEDAAKTSNEHRLGKEVNAILDQSIGPKDYVRDDVQKTKVIEHFEYNLEKIAELTASVGAKLIMVAPASKLRNETPFKSVIRDDLIGLDLEDWQQYYQSAQKLFREKKLIDALSAILKAEALDPRHAHALSLKGDILYAMERFDEAKAAYQKSLDEDVCPLRAISPLHAISLDVAHEMKIPIVDFDAIISRLSPNEITDEVFFLDHVHPTIEGNKILALELLKSIIESGMIESPRPMTVLSQIESLKKSQIQQDQQSEALSNLAMLANWGGKFNEGRILAERAIELNHDSAYAYYQKAMSILGLGENIEEAIIYFDKVLSINGSDNGVFQALGDTYALLDRNEEARSNYLLALDSSDTWVLSMTHFGLAKLLQKEGELEAALQHYRQTLEVEPTFYKAEKRIDSILMLHPELMDEKKPKE